MSTGTSPCDFELPSGSYLVVVTKTGYKMAQRAVTHDSAVGEDVHFELEAETPTQPSTTAQASSGIILIPLAGLALAALLLLRKKK